MKLAVLHYHLNRGGVSRVIANQLRALDAALGSGEPAQVALLHGGRREGWENGLLKRLRSIRLSLHEVPLLDYDAVHRVRGRRLVEGLHQQITEELQSLGWAPDESVLQVHNHALGKNAALPQVVGRLAAEGFALLLQIHDFAEDLRPENYRHLCHGRPPQPWKRWPDVLYPQAPHIHYAVLNGRDHAILRAAGMAPDRLHLLPNPVSASEDIPSRAAARQRLAEQFGVGPQDRYAVYPVRGIRRKNLGEVLLLSALAPPGTTFGVTLPPLNPAERPIYETWRQAADDLRLPCLFETGGPGHLSFGENLAAADRLVTCSAAEGFGMVFLESWLAGRVLIGRDLPEVTADYTAAGLRLPTLYSRLVVPLDWVGVERFGRALVRAYRSVLEAYGREQAGDINDALEEKTRNGLVDFADLDEGFQQQVIETVARSQANRRRLFHENAALEPSLVPEADDTAALVEHNAAIVREHYSLQASGARLLDLVRRTGAAGRETPPSALPNTEHILDRFLDLRRFRMIRA